MLVYISKLAYQISDYDLLRDKYSNLQKEDQARNLFQVIQSKIKNFPNINSPISMTNVPYFDINYKLLLQLATESNKNTNLNLTPKREVQILNQNIDLFEKLFGFEFSENRFINAITNQSLFTFKQLYPDIQSDSLENKPSLLKESIGSDLELNKDKSLPPAKATLRLCSESALLTSQDLIFVN